MRTLGVDLASRPKNTAICEIAWSGEAALVATVAVGVTDPIILERARSLVLDAPGGPAEDAIGIDAPFGWPQPFVELVGRAPTGIRHMPAFDPARTRDLCYRLTDRRVHEELGLVPLSVACDKLAYSALRCAGLLDDLGVVDRSGVDGVFEVYPAAALKAWGLPHQGYKGDSALAKANRAALFERVRQTCSRLSFPNPADELLCATSDHAFDAFIASLAARAAALGSILHPATLEDAERARVEGWITIPTRDFLAGC